jgi:hypothetical protein
VLCVFEAKSGRVGVQPWVDDAPEATTKLVATNSAEVRSPLVAVIRDLHQACEDLILLGLRRADLSVANQWHDLQKQFESVGLVQLSKRHAVIAAELQKRQHIVQWNAQPAAEMVLQLLALQRLLQDVAPPE